MNEEIFDIRKSNRKNKKYVATVGDAKKKRKIHFGDSRYEQYRDSTNIGAFSKKDHRDEKRRRNYFKRHSGVNNKKDAIKKEIKESNGKYNAKILSHLLLW